VTQDGRAIRRCTRGEGVGEIALLYDVPRTSTVTAVDDVTVYGLDRAPFLAVLTGHALTRQRAEDVALGRLADDERRREP
jgi:CRP-like cAMP-binding protein